MKKPLIERDGRVAQIRSTETLAIPTVAVGSQDIDPSATLQVGGDKGILVPRMDTDKRDAIVSPADGLMIYNTETGQHEEFVTGTGWRAIGEMPNPIDCGTF